VTAGELDRAMRAELRSLPSTLADTVARHLVMADRLLAEEPENGYRHAVAARKLASRVGSVRAVSGMAAYRTGRWAEALSELRAARRMSRTDSFLPIIADAERGLGRPERSLELAQSPDAERLAENERVELRIVESGARRDLGQYAAAVVALQTSALSDTRRNPWSVRLLYAYADALLDDGREDDAKLWFAHAAQADHDGETDAEERYNELDGLFLVDMEDEDDEADDDAAPDDSGTPQA